jgi:hypothetical protein
MSFDAKAFGDQVAAILALDGSGERLMPLTVSRCSSDRAREMLRASTAHALFPSARAPEAALAGLYLYFSCFDDAHEIAQRIDSVDGSFWHAIVHRQEPDAGNSSYWFRRAGLHPIFPALAERAAGIGGRYSVKLPAAWDPFAFINLCEAARERPGSNIEKAALEIQRAEWQLLFDHCAR